MLYCAIDVGKTKHEVLMVDENKEPVCKSRQVPESREGHDELLNLLRQHANGHQITVSFEATGVYYQNIVHTLAQSELNLIFYRLNPYTVKHYAQSFLHRQTDDKISASVIASMTVDRRQDLFTYEPEPQDDLACVAIEMYELKKQLTALINRLRKEVFLANPEVESVFKDIDSAQSLALLSHYPTASELAHTRVSTVASLRGGATRSHRIGEEKARTLIQQARSSVASDTTSQRASKIKRLVKHIQLLKHQLAQCDKTMAELLGPDPAPQEPGRPLPQPSSPDEKQRQDIALLDSIPGIGLWGATAFVALVGDISRFSSFEKLNAFVGTCPRYARSGKHDSSHGTMSKHGSRRLRWLLYILTLTALRENPIISSYYQKHLATGKKRLKAHAACMTKLLRIIYGVIKTRTTFDIDYREKKKS